MEDLRVAIPGPPKDPHNEQRPPSGGPSWLLQTVQLTPPYSPSASPTEEPRKAALAAPEAFPSPVTPNHLLLPKALCCERHQAAPLAADGLGLLSEGCVGSRTLDKGFPVPAWATGMSPKELELRLQLCEVQMLYRAKQAELSVIKKLGAKKRTPKPAAVAKSASTSAAKAPSPARKRPGSQPPSPLAKERASPGLLRTHIKPLHPSPLTKLQSTSAKLLATPERPRPVALPQAKEETEETEVEKTQTKMEEEEAKTEVETTQTKMEEEAEEEKTEVETETEQTVKEEPADIPDVRLSVSALWEGRRVMVLESGLFYPGSLTVLDAEALLYGIRVDGQRSARPHILCLDDLVKGAMLEVVPSSESQLCIGNRVAAFWSGQIRALYPGTVQAKGNGGGVEIQFDDGDSGLIAISDIRLLPQDFPLTKVEPVLPDFITRKRSSRGASDPMISPLSIAPALKRHSHPTSAVAKTPEKSGEADWEWLGPGTLNAKKKRICYTTVSKGKSQFQVGDVVHLQARGAHRAAPGSPSTTAYVGRLQGMWEPRPGKKHVKRVSVSWLYRASEVALPAGVSLPSAKDALFASTHDDENSVETISNRCALVSFAQFTASHQKTQDGGRSRVYYLAGSYDPVSQDIHWEPDVLTQFPNAESPSL